MVLDFGDTESWRGFHHAGQMCRIPIVTSEVSAMLEKLIIRLERLQVRLERKYEQKRHARSLKSAKMEITRLARMRVL